MSHELADGAFDPSRTEEEKQLRAGDVRAFAESEDKYRSIFDSIDEGFCIIEMVQDASGATVDYLFVDVNPAFERQTGLCNVTGKRASELTPGTEAYWIENYDDVACTGKSRRFENFHAATGRWYDVFASRMGDAEDRRVCIVFDDVTERKRAEVALREREADLARVQRIGRVGGLDIDIAGGMKGWRSPEYLRLHGLPQHTVRENHEQWRQRVHPEDRERAERALFRALNGKGFTYECEYRIVRPSDGAVRWIHARGDIERDSRGRATRLRGAHLDITEQKQLQEALRESEERQVFLLKFSDELRVQTDSDSVANLAINLLADQLALDLCYAVSVDASLEQATVTHQARRGDFPAIPTKIRTSDFFTSLLRNFDETVVANDVAGDPDFSDRDRRSLAALHFGAYVVGVVARNERNPIWALVAVSGSPRKWRPSEVSLIEEVAGRTGSALERVRTEEVMREADRRKDEFLAMLAHELRNPLAAIRNAVRIIARADSDRQKIQTASEILDRQVATMVRQVDDLLDVSRITRNKIELRKEQTELVSIVNLAIEGTRGLCERLGHELIVTLPETPIYLDGDRIRLAQVVSNLLNNACKFTDRNGSILIELRCENGHAVIRIKDTGIGLASDKLTKIFEMFAQVDQSLERNRDGLGLGLSLVKSLVEMHGGSVEARSDGLGQGSEFIVRLPLPPTVSPSLQEAPMEIQSMNLSSRRVLVADDNKDSAASLAMLLAMMGHEVDTASDGLEAVQRAEAFQADFILLDIGMPGLNGYEAARKIRKQQPDGLTIVAMTGWGQDEDRRRSKEAGFDAHLVKPVDMASLVQLLGERDASKSARRIDDN